jgi:hypothetical protein
VKVLLLIGIVGALIIVPFYRMRARWAVDLWRRIKLIAIIYCVVVFVAAVTRLIFNFDAIYG